MPVSLIEHHKISLNLYSEARASTADNQIEVTEDRIILKGNAKLSSSRNETIEADEIQITKN